MKEQNHQDEKVGVRGVLHTELQAMGHALGIPLCLCVCSLACLFNEWLLTERRWAAGGWGAGYALDLARRSTDALEAPVTAHSVPERSIQGPQSDTWETGRNEGPCGSLEQRDLTPGCQRKEGKFRLKPKGQGEHKVPGL